MCECSKGYVCPQHTARVNAAAKIKTAAKRPKGITIGQAIAIMQKNRDPYRGTFYRNRETAKATRILMGAYFSSGERGYPSIQQIVEKFSHVPTIIPPKTVSSNGGYEIKTTSVGHFVVWRKADGIVRYLGKGGEERTSCRRNNLDGTGGYFPTKLDAEEAIAAHKNRVATNWAKLSREIEARSYTIESKTLGEGIILLKRLDKYDITKCLNKSGLSEVEPSHVYLPKPITELGYYKVLLQFPSSLEIYASIWVVPV